MFWMYYRAGSMMALHLLGSNSSWVDGQAKSYRKATENTWWLPTSPQNQGFARHIHSGGISEALSRDHYGLVQGHNPSVFLCTSRIGNWWGEKRSADVPLPYQDPSPMKWSYQEVLPLNVDQHILLIRDGRNQIESTRRLKGGIEEKHQATDPEDYFVSLCKGFRNRARLALDCSYMIPNYKVFKFEDLLADPIGTMSSILDCCGLQMNETFVSVLWDELEKRRVCKSHSSFDNNKKMNHRWEGWTDKEKRIFQEIAGKELIELGYEENNVDW
jgi:hypothetical protein